MEAELAHDYWIPFSNWQFCVACLVIMVVMLFTKKMIAQAKPALYSKGFIQSSLTGMNLLLGLALAIPKGFLFGSNFFQRCLVGIVAGGTNHILYHLLLKRLGLKEDDRGDVNAK